MLLYGREKIGKTTFFSQFPKTLFLTTEPGTKGLRVMEVSCSDWHTVEGAVKALLTKEAQDTFEFVVFDTVDRAYDLCLDCVCSERGISYPSEDPDWGQTWREIKRRFASVIERLAHAGYGLGFTSHVREEVVKERSGRTYTRIYPSMSKQARTVVEALVDFFLYADYVKDTKGNTRRILVCEGDETIWAGSREVDGVSLPRFLPLKKEGAYELMQKAFNGKVKGINPRSLVSSPGLTTDALDKLLKRIRSNVRG